MAQGTGKLVARALIGTKLYVPKPRPGLVTRPRLLDLLRRGEQARLTLVSAPAGFGKTTLLSDWVRAAPAPGRAVAWVSLDAADDDPSSFWTYVVTGLQTSGAGVGSSTLKVLATAPEPPSERALTILLNELAEAAGDVWLVLDDYHLIDDHGIRDGLTFFLEHLPPNVHVLLSTRADPDLPLSRWRGRGELVEVRAADLRFTPDETTTYLNMSARLDLTAPDVEALAERTEGWIAALQLAALSIRGRADVSGFIARFAGDDRYIVDYLVEEVLAHQTDRVRDFVLHTAVLERLTGPLCDTLTSGADGDRMLEALERANLFLVPLDDRRQWYRYHHLFADVLRARLLAEDPDLVPVLHERASDWYERHDLLADAIRHALAAGDSNRAAHLMELALPSVRRHRQEAQLLAWLGELPDRTLRGSPVLGVFRGHLHLLSGDLDAAEQRLDVAERTLSAGPATSALAWADTDELRTLPATIAVYRASIAQARGDVPGTVAHARRGLDLAGPDDHLARGGAAGFLGLAAWAQGDVAGALRTFAQAVASLHAGGNLVDELSSTVVLADLWLVAGRPGAARRLYLRALQAGTAHGGPVLRAVPDLHVGLGELDHEAGDLDSAKGHLEQSAALAEDALGQGRYRWFVAMARVAAAAGDPKEALQLLDRAEQLYRRSFFPEVRPIAALRARVWITDGNLSPAADWAGERGVSTTDEPRYLSEFDHLTLARLRLAQHRRHSDLDELEQTVRLLDRLHAAAEAAGRAGSLLEIRVVQALAHEARGDRQQAREHLARAWREAPEPNAYARLFLDEGAPMIELLRDAERQGDPGGHADRLLRLHAARAASAVRDAEAPSTAASSTAEALSDRELQVLRLLESDLTGPQIARELFVSHNTVRTHTKHIFAKLDVTNRRAAVRRARERGLL